MTQKLLLAESLDLLHQCEVREYDIDRIKGKGSKNHSEITKLYKSYDDVFHEYVRGVEILNYVRHCSMDDRDPANAAYNQNLINFCQGKMTAYMDRCENVQKKMDSILLPISQVDTIGMEGFTPEDTIFMQDGTTYPLTRKESKVAKEFNIVDGTYVLIIKNKDDYTLASPTVDIQVTVTPQRGSGAEPTRVGQKLPCQCAWRKVFGVVGSCTLQMEIASNGMRDSHLDVSLQRYVSMADIGNRPPPTEYTFDSNLNTVVSQNRIQTSTATSSSSPTGGWANQLPPLPDDELATLANYNVPKDSLPVRTNSAAPAPAPAQPDPWAALQQMNVPYQNNKRNSSAVYSVPDPIQVNPPGLNCQQRLQRISNMLDAWPGDGCVSTNLPMDKQMFIQKIYALPFPREIG